MTSFLLCTIYAPLVSWGDTAVGEVRGSWDRPSRSAILGLVAASLGIPRETQERHDTLDRGLGMAVRLDAAGIALIDYHTTQTVAATIVKRQRPATRRQLLLNDDRETILSRRTLRQDTLATVALWIRQDMGLSLDEIGAALRQPVFTVYAGRKANPFGLPLNPEVVTAQTLAVAFAQRSPEALESVLGRHGLSLLRPREGWNRVVAHDPCEGFDSGLHEHQQRVVRRDRGAQRIRWQFSDRLVLMGTLPTEPV